MFSSTSSFKKCNKKLLKNGFPGCFWTFLDIFFEKNNPAQTLDFTGFFALRDEKDVFFTIKYKKVNFSIESIRKKMSFYPESDFAQNVVKKGDF